MCKTIEDKITREYPNIEKLDSGSLEIIINDYSIRLLTEEEGNLISLMKDGIDLKIPNKFEKNNRNEALIFYVQIIKAVSDKAEYDNSCKENEKEKNRRLPNGKLIPSLEFDDSFIAHF